MNSQAPQTPRRAASRLASFRHAFAGWRHVLRTQRNAWIHAIASVAVFAVSFWLGLERIEWAILLLTVALVWTAEFVNTAVEALADLLSPDIHPLAKVAKDVAAAAVLIAALAAVGVGLLVLGPPLWARLKTTNAHARTSILCCGADKTPRSPKC
ncbi:MAG TPA: diacylglycerol kinase family protein [Gemmataceae bacterium]